MTRLTSRSDGRGRPLSALIAGWAAGNPRIRRVWLFAGPAADPARRDEDIALTVELQPVGDSEETLALWMTHCEQWRRQLQAQIGQAVRLGWCDPDGATTAMPASLDEAKSLIYERAS